MIPEKEPGYLRGEVTISSTAVTAHFIRGAMQVGRSSLLSTEYRGKALKRGSGL